MGNANAVTEQMTVIGGYYAAQGAINWQSVKRHQVQNNKNEAINLVSPSFIIQATAFEKKKEIKIFV